MHPRKKVSLTGEFLEDFLSDGQWFRNEAPIPLGATLRSARWDRDRFCFDLVFEHPSFPMVEEGKVPELILLFHTRGSA